MAKGHPQYYQDMAEKLAADTPDAYFINQFAIRRIRCAHEWGTGPEIWRQMTATWTRSCSAADRRDDDRAFPLFARVAPQVESCSPIRSCSISTQ